MMDGGDSSRGGASPNMGMPFPTQPAGLLNGDNQKLFGVTNNTNIKLKGDGNGAFTLGNFK
ncbi:hypothetical protein CR513_16642, partial [Mucuna pruriens]